MAAGYGQRYAQNQKILINHRLKKPVNEVLDKEREYAFAKAHGTILQHSAISVVLYTIHHSKIARLGYYFTFSINQSINQHQLNKKIDQS